MIIIISQIKYLGISGITLFPFIILRDKSLKEDKRIMNHEHIHIHQQVELLVLPFYILYVIEYVIGLIKYRNRFSAYMNISFEKEAYKNDSDLKYLKERRLWAWLSEFKVFSLQTTNFSSEAGAVLIFFAYFFASRKKSKWGFRGKAPIIQSDIKNR